MIGGPQTGSELLLLRGARRRLRGDRSITNNLKLGHKMLHSDWVIKPFKRREKMLTTIGKTKLKYTQRKITNLQFNRTYKLSNFIK